VEGGCCLLYFNIDTIICTFGLPVDCIFNLCRNRRSHFSSQGYANLYLPISLLASPVEHRDSFSGSSHGPSFDARQENVMDSECHYWRND
jgi:hypothetical protein